MNKAYVYRLYPTADQKILFAKTFGCCRKIWNLMLGDRIDAYNDYGITLLPTPAWYKSDDRYSYLKEVDSLALANVQLALQKAYKAFFDGIAEFPKFKSKRRAKLSYTTNNQGGTISVADNAVRLPKVGMVKAKIHRNAPSYMKLKSATVSCDKCGRYYISVLYEYDKTDTSYKASDPEKLLGLDYKSDGLYVDSEGRCADMPHFYRKAQKKLKHLQRELSRKVGSKKGEMPSHNFKKQLAKVRKQYRHVTDQRRDYLQKRSTALADEYDLIGVEDLSLKGMSSSKGLGLGKATNDNGFGMFVQMLAYKMADRNKHLIKVGRTFPSSQLCQCGYKNPITKDLSVRTVVCPVCGRIYNRDVNAAINIRNEAYRIFRCGEQVDINVGWEPPKLKPVELALTGYTFSGVCQLPPVLKQEARLLVAEQFTDPNDINNNMFLSPEEKEKYGFENYFSPDQIIAIVPAQTDTYYFCFFKYTPMDDSVLNSYLDRWVKRERAKDKTESS